MGHPRIGAALARTLAAWALGGQVGACGGGSMAPMAPTATVAIESAPEPPAGGCPERMASVPGGEFQVVARSEPHDRAPAEYRDETRTAHLEPFCIDLTEVSVERYVDAGARGTVH